MKSNLETDIFNYKTPEFYINMKNIPDKASSERKAFVLEEKKKCREGINVNGIYIPGGLYTHLNYYHLEGDSKTNPGKKEIMLPTLRDNEWIIFNDYDFCQKNGKIYPLFGGRQISKDLLDSSLLYQENGEITIGSAKVGDRIYDESGKLTTITRVHPQGIRPVYKMTLLDGREILCGLDHNWYVWNRKSSKYEVKTTRDLLNDYKHERKDWVGKRKNTFEFKYGIPNSKCVQYPEKELPIDPYLLGLWLGDGSNYYSKITTIDKEIVDYLEQISAKMGLHLTKDGDVTYMITAKSEGNKHSQKNIFHKFLQENKLYQNKHIPNNYLYSSEDQRLELLKGLMDSDGTCGKGGVISFSSSIPKLAEDVIKLCRSLGITVSCKLKPSSYKKEGKLIKCKDSHQITLFTERDVFKLPRKLERCTAKKKYLNFTSIINIEYLFDDYTTCITVDNESHLFLTDGYTVTHNSETEVSLCLRELSLYTPTEAIALFANDAHRDTFVKKARTALAHGEKFIYVPNIDKDWSKSEIRFGITRQDNTVDLRGTLYIYNTQEGKKIQVGSGKTASFLLFDEAATAPFKAVLDTMEPALLTDLGTLRCAPMIAFTGGETQKAEDAKNLVEFPSKEKCFITTLDDGKEIGGRFMDGRFRKDCKKLSTISQYTGIITETWIDDYPIMVTDFDYAIKKITFEREEAAKDPNKNSLILKKIFFPLTLEDVFLTESNNRFNKEAIGQYQTWLRNHYEPTYVDFYRDMNRKVVWKNSDKMPISKFPVRPNDNKDAPVLIFEHPVPNAPNFTYCIGIDPINNEDSNDKEVSLFTIKVFKRMLSPLDEFKNETVCSYRGRPSSLEEAHELALMIAEYYNAIEGVLPEASESSIFQYFFLKRKGHFLANTFDLVTEINKKTSFRGKKGLPATTVNQRHYMNIMVEYANEEMISVNEEGEEEMKYGFTRIKDPMLLEEMKNYKGKTVGKGVHDGNFDSIISFGCALTLAKYYDAKYPIASQIPSKNENTHQRASTVRTPFGIFEKNSNIFGFDKPKIKLPGWLRK